MKLNKELKDYHFFLIIISLKVKPIHPSLYINRFASQMEFGDQLPVFLLFLFFYSYRLFLLLLYVLQSECNVIGLFVVVDLLVLSLLLFF